MVFTMDTSMNRRSFLFGLAATAITAAVVVPEIATAAMPASTVTDTGADFLTEGVQARGTIIIDGQAHFLPGDTVTIGSSHSGENTYEITAISKDGGTLTLAHITVGEYHTLEMRHNEFEPFLNEEIRRHGLGSDTTITATYSYETDGVDQDETLRAIYEDAGKSFEEDFPRMANMLGLTSGYEPKPRAGPSPPGSLPRR
jgi:hypothetical protein